MLDTQSSHPVTVHPTSALLLPLVPFILLTNMLVSSTAYCNFPVGSFSEELLKPDTALTSCFPFIYFSCFFKSAEMEMINIHMLICHLGFLVRKWVLFRFQASLPLLQLMPTDCPSCSLFFLPAPSVKASLLSLQHLCTCQCATAELILIEFLSPCWNCTQWLHLINCSKLLIASVLDRELINPDISNTF